MRVQLSGRLGNQLFELAHAFELSKKTNQNFSLVWDDHSYPNGLNEDLSKLSLSYLQKSNAVGLALKILDKVKKHSPLLEYALCRAIGIYREGHKKRSKTTRIVSGFYQDYLWAERSYTEMAELLVKAKKQVQHQIDKLSLPKHYQVIHYRRGDYSGHKGNFGVISVDYYKANIDRGLPTVVLTDSFERANELFKPLGNLKVISPEECDAWAALIVMSEAHSIISSNSTLSWWGAFFAIKNGGAAVIPKPFFANGAQTSLFHPEFATAESIFEERPE
jgi:hypothetical protein